MKTYKGVFRRNEFYTVLGRRQYNLWILVVVFVLVIGSLAFSTAGRSFLKKKMEDPFINWVNVSNEPELENFYKALEEGLKGEDSAIMRFEIDAVERNNYMVEFLEGGKRMIGRTLSSQSGLWEKILHPSNTMVCRFEDIKEGDFGWVVSADFLEGLGYGINEKDYPLFLSWAYRSQEGEHSIPIPLMAVVERLPDDIDFVTTNYFYEQRFDETHPFDVEDSSRYFNRVQFVSGSEDMQDTLRHFFDSVKVELEWEASEPYGLAYREAWLYSAIIYDTMVRLGQMDTLCRDICKKFPDVYRCYEYEFGKGFELNPDYVSVMFRNLTRVKEFQLWAKEKYGVRIDMAQIEAKENFNIFNNLAVGLCVAIILMAISFVSIFLYFLISAHFQKISKNLGTIMAFGLDNRNIVRIYTGVFMMLIILGLLVALVLLLSFQLIFQRCGIGYDLNGEVYPYLDLWNAWVGWVLLGILTLSGLVIVIFLSRKLKSTPGDLIYERTK